MRQAECGNETFGYFAGGRISGTNAISAIYYSNFSNSGETGSFGNLTVARRAIAGLSSPTRGIFSGGSYGITDINTYNVIDYITLGTSGSASDFGDMSHTICGIAACSDGIIGVFAGGYYPNEEITEWIYSTTIEKVTVATTGNSSSFGELTEGRAGIGAFSNQTKGFFAGGSDTTCVITPHNNIDSLSFSTGGTVSNFGELTTPRDSMGACSNCHGGLS